MVRKMFAKFAAGSVVALGLFAWTSQANAFGHHHWHGSSGGSWGSSGGSSGGSWGSSGGSSGGSWGSSGGSSGGYSVQSVPSAPAAAPAPGVVPGEVPADGAVAPTNGASIGSGRAAILSVRVPAEAKLYVNGMLTRSTGSERRYISNGLRPGFNYTYELRAQTERNGQMVEERKVVQLQAGQTAEVDFPLNGGEQADERTATRPLQTTLKLRVPADAKVFLSGTESKSVGSTREFVTTKLAPGQSWDNYTVRVEFELNGQMVSKTEKISLSAGESRELTIDADAAQVAQVTTGSDLQ
jgi:uncharacterized protein (TIGR03000 family)